jgi:mono/diheme cytochrome c family protein
MSDSEIILGLFALVLVVFSLVVALVIPRRDPDFPGRRMPVFIAVAILLVVAMLAAVEVFGAEDEHGEEAAETQTMEGGTGATETGATETGATETGGEEGGGDAAAGEEIFASAGCGSCHTLEEAGTDGTVGPNLDDSQIDEAGAVQQITGGGGGMPPFDGQLSQQEIQDVAAFVVASEG